MTLEPDSLKAFKTVNKTLVKNGNWFLAVDKFPYISVNAGDSFNYGEYEFSVFPLRGHTYGQMGLKETNKKLLFCADQIIDGVSPIVATTFSFENLLNEYFLSINDIKENYSNWLLIPSHGKLIKDPKKAINAILESYEKKIERVMEVFKEKNKPLTVVETARAVYNYSSLPEDVGEFFQFKMIITKTSSILEYLCFKKELIVKNKSGIDYYSLPFEF